MRQQSPFHLSTPPDQRHEPLRFSTRRTPCPTCGARHGFAELIGHDSGGKCHACGVFVPPLEDRPAHTYHPLSPKRSHPSPPKPERPIASKTSWTLFRTHDYYDEEGTVLYHIDRYHQLVTYRDGATEQAKTFRQRPAGVPCRQRDDAEATPIGGSMAGVRLVLYELPSILAAIAKGAPVWIVEGEKAADWLNLWFREELGWPDRATTAPGGSNGWRDEFADFLVGAVVRIWSDADEAGKRHADDVLKSMNGTVPGVRIVQLDCIPPIPDDD